VFWKEEGDGATDMAFALLSFGGRTMERIATFLKKKPAVGMCVMEKKIQCKGGGYICVRGLEYHVRRTLEEVDEDG
jgi:hypothetical protein